MEQRIVDMFLQVLNYSMVGGFLTLGMLILRQIFRYIPKRYICLLWGVVGFRLAFPALLPFWEGLLPVRVDAFTYEKLAYGNPTVQTGLGSVDLSVNAVLFAVAAPATDAVQSINPMQVYMLLGAFVWLLGIVVYLLWNLFGVVCWKLRLRTAVQTEEKDVYETDRVGSPILFGLVRPRVYVPCSMLETDRKYAVMHERLHRRRGDHVWKLLACILLAVHWFNPLVWAAFYFFVQDLEMACDESVLKELEPEARISYGEALLHLAETRSGLNRAMTLGFGESASGRRIKNVLKYRKPAAMVTVLCMILVIAAVAVGLFGGKREQSYVLAGGEWPYGPIAVGEIPDEVRGRHPLLGELADIQWEEIEELRLYKSDQFYDLTEDQQKALLKYLLGMSCVGTEEDNSLGLLMGSVNTGEYGVLINMKNGDQWYFKGRIGKNLDGEEYSLRLFYTVEGEDEFPAQRMWLQLYDEVPFLDYVQQYYQ